jgi:zinc/manganese transport system permease protein
MLTELLVAPFSEFAFMQRALLGCTALAVSATPVGVLLLLRGMSLSGEAIAHGILPGVAVAYVISGLSVAALTLGGLIGGLAVALIAGWVSRTTVLREDASLAALYLIAMATGVLLISSVGRNVDLLHLLFGGVLALDDASLGVLGSISAVSVIVMLVLHRALIFESVDPDFMRVVSGRGVWIQSVFVFLVVINLIAGFHALGTLLALSIMILPAAAARLWSDRIGVILILAPVIAWISAWLGLLLSYHLEAAAGPAIVGTAGAVFVVSLLLARSAGKSRLAGGSPAGGR